MTHSLMLFLLPFHPFSSKLLRLPRRTSFLLLPEQALGLFQISQHWDNV